MKFKNYKEYMELRDNLLAEAQKASEEGNQEEFDAKRSPIWMQSGTLSLRDRRT